VEGAAEAKAAAAFSPLSESEMMAPRPPNYAQDRLQRERAQAAKTNEKAERRAQEAALRKAEKERTEPSGS
jgi:hypothetical protein